MAQIEKLGNIQLMFQGGIGPVVAYRHTSHQSRNIGHGIARTILQVIGAMNKSLESEVGIEPTFAVLQTDAYSSIDNSPVAGASRVEQDSWDLESQAQPHIPCSY